MQMAGLVFLNDEGKGRVVWTSPPNGAFRLRRGFEVSFGAIFCQGHTQYLQQIEFHSRPLKQSGAPYP